MINDVDGIMRASAKKMTKWNEDLYCAMKFMCRKVCN